MVAVLQMESFARPLFISQSIYELDVGTYDNVLTVRTYDLLYCLVSLIKSLFFVAQHVYIAHVPCAVTQAEHLPSTCRE